MSYESERSGASHAPWSLPKFKYPSLKESIETDILIIGAGMTGLQTAYQLLATGLKIVIIDDGQLISGESSRSTAHLSSALDDKYYEIEKVRGLEGVKLAYQSHAGAIETLAEIIKREKIECQFSRLSGYLLASSTKDESILTKEYQVLKQAGIALKPPSPLENMPNFSLALEFPSQAQFDPVAYLSALADIIGARGGLIYQSTQALNIEAGEPNRITCKDDINIYAKHCISATNAPSFGQNLLFAKEAPFRTYAIQALLDKALEPALYWDTVDPYHYVRFSQQGSQVSIIIGGEDRRCGNLEQANLIFKDLENWGRQHFPQMKDVTHKWSGQIIEPIDYLAFIGRRKANENIYVATGDSGNGLTHAVIASQIITDLVQNRSNPYQALYSPSRLVYKPPSKLIKHNFDAVLHYLDYAGLGELEDVQDLQANEGAILQKGFHKYACAKTSDDQTMVVSPICPHMGGLLEWNELEQSWDCPMHGSRFAANGQMLIGPATSNLKIKTLKTNDQDN